MESDKKLYVDLKPHQIEFRLSEGREITLSPEEFQGVKMLESPDKLAVFISKTIEENNMIPRAIILRINTELGFFKTYKYKYDTKENAEGMFWTEVERSLGKPEDFIVEKLEFGKSPDLNGMYGSAIYGIEDKFLRVLVKELKSLGIKVVYACDTTADFLMKMRHVLSAMVDDEKHYTTAIKVSEDDFVLFTFDEGDLVDVRLQEFPGDVVLPDEMAPYIHDIINEVLFNTDDELTLKQRREASRVLLYVEEADKVIEEFVENVEELDEDIESGDDSFIENVTEAIDEVLDIEVINVNDKIDETQDILNNKAGSLDNTAKRMMANANYLYGGVEKRKNAKNLKRITALAIIATIVLMSVIPGYSAYLQYKNQTLEDKIAEVSVSGERELITRERELTKEYIAYKNSSEYVDSLDIRHGELLSILNKNLLKDVEVNEIFYDKETHLILDIIVDDKKEFNNKKNKLNDNREVQVAQITDPEKLDDERWKIQLKVTYSARESEMTQGGSER